MQGFRKVLFVVEGRRNEEAALQQLAADLQAGSRLTLIDVVPDAQQSFVSLPLKGSMQRLQKAMLRERRAALQQLVENLQRELPDLRINTLVREGNDCVEIVRQAIKGRHDLVAKLAGGESRIEGLLFGNLDMNLLRKCPTPVLILKDHRRPKRGRVLAAVELMHEVPEREALDRRVVELAARLARANGAQLDLLHAWFLQFEKALRINESDAAFHTVDDMLRDLRSLQRTRLQSLARMQADLAPALHLVKGRAQEVIPRFVHKHRVQLVVMGTVGRTGVAGLFIGNTAERILQQLDCSVLAIKPEGFVSPIV
jgi:universal stress protein E